MSDRLLRGTVLVSIMLALVLAGGVLVNPSYSEEGGEQKVPAPGSYARFQDVKIDSPDENFFAGIKFEDLPTEFKGGEEAQSFRYRFKPGSRDYYIVVTEGTRTADTPFGKQNVNHRMEVLLDHTVESVEEGVASVKQTVHDFWVSGRRKLPSPGGSARDILIRKRWFGDVIKVWSGEDLLADNQGTVNDPQGAQVVAHLTKEIVRMTQDITFLSGTDGRTTEMEGPAEFVALFGNDFGSPFGLVLPKEKIKPGTSFVRKEKSPLTEITVSGLCADDLVTKPVEKEFKVTYLGDATVGGYECAVFRVIQDQQYEGLTSSRETPRSEFPVAIHSVKIERTRTVYFAKKEGKVIAYDARHRTKAEFAVQTPMGDMSFETEAKTRWSMILHDGLKFDERVSAD